MAISKEQRRKAARKQQNTEIQNRGGSGNSILDLSAYSGVKHYKITKDNAQDRKKFELDIIPFIVSIDNHPKGIEKGYFAYKCDYWRHRKVGPGEEIALCRKLTLGLECPVCERYDILVSLYGKKHKDAKAIKPQHRGIYNVIDLKGEDESIQLLDFSFELLEKKILAEVDDLIKEGQEEVIFFDLEEGFSITFKAVIESGGDFTYAACESVALKARGYAYPEDILNEAYPLDVLMQVPEYDDIVEIMGTQSVEAASVDQTETTQTQAAKTTRVRKRKTTTVAPEETNEEKAQPTKTRTTTRRRVNKNDSATEPVTQPETKKRVQRRPPKAAQEPETGTNEGPSCPHGHNWGEAGQEDACSSCDDETFNLCADAANS